MELSTTRRRSTKTAQQTRGRRDSAVVLESILPNFAPERSPNQERTLTQTLERLKMLILRVEARHHVRASRPLEHRLLIVAARGVPHVPIL